MKRRESYASVADRPDIGEHAEAFETGAGFMRAFGVLIAALASTRGGLRRVFVAVPHLRAMRVHLVLGGRRVRMRASHRAHGCFPVSGRNKSSARVEYQAHGNHYGQQDVHRCHAQSSIQLRQEVDARQACCSP